MLSHLRFLRQQGHTFEKEHDEESLSCPHLACSCPRTRKTSRRLYREKAAGEDGRERSYTSYFVVRVQEQGDPGKAWSDLQAHKHPAGPGAAEGSILDSQYDPEKTALRRLIGHKQCPSSRDLNAEVAPREAMPVTWSFVNLSEGH